MEDDDISHSTRPESLLPYEAWVEEATRGVAIRALQYALPRACPASIIFTSASAPTTPASSFPTRLLAQYPEEMTIVLQHSSGT